MSKQGARAFPKPQSAGISGDAQPGMSMRQYYNAAALKGLLANSGTYEGQEPLLSWISTTSPTSPQSEKLKWLAELSGKLSDAMLAEDAEFEARKS